MKAPRVVPLEGASMYASAGAYVSMHFGGHDADERRFIALEYIALVRLFLYVALSFSFLISTHNAHSFHLLDGL
jgi:hypothetical protein